MKLDRLKLPHVRMTSKDLDVENALRVKLYGRPADVEKAWLVVAKARLRQACDPTSRLLTLARPIGATGVRMAEAPEVRAQSVPLVHPKRRCQGPLGGPTSGSSWMFVD